MIGKQMSEAVLEGEVRMWRDERGFGFIRRDDGMGDIFAHIRNIRGGHAALSVGQRVRFSGGTNPNNHRTCAVEVELCEPIISPVATPRAFRPDAGDAGDEHTAHMELAQTTFMRR
jgi:cold shock CspA family protein